MTDSKQYRVGIVGCGRVAAMHAKGYTEVPDTQLAAAADIDPDKLDSFCEQWSIPQRYSSYEEMLAQGGRGYHQRLHARQSEGAGDDRRGRGRACAASCAKSRWPSTLKRPIA